MVYGSLDDFSHDMACCHGRKFLEEVGWARDFFKEVVHRGENSVDFDLCSDEHNLFHLFLSFFSMNNTPPVTGTGTIERPAPPPTKQPTLFTGLKASYGDQNATSRLQQTGWEKDKELSDHRNQVYFNPSEGKIMMSVAGTHNAKDWLTDVALAMGNLKSTKRYQSAKKTLEKAKLKYEKQDATVIGHSLGGSIAQKVAGKNDRVLAVDSGFTIGEKVKKGHTAIRSKGDLVSIFGNGQKTIGKWKNPLHAHRLKNIKSQKIFI